MKIRPVKLQDQSEWLRLRQALWPDTETAHLDQMTQLGATPTVMETFVLERLDGHLGGFLEVGIRDYAEGCETERVGYIEGWYVEPDLQQQGWGRQLVKAAEAWAIARGITEMASDCELDNAVSLAAHQALAYEEVDRIICFRKKLDTAKN